MTQRQRREDTPRKKGNGMEEDGREGEEEEGRKWQGKENRGGKGRERKDGWKRRRSRGERAGGWGEEGRRGDGRAVERRKEQMG
jgi:hypothetical protein